MSSETEITESEELGDAIAPAATPWYMRLRLHAALFVVGLIVYGGMSGSRMSKQSTDPHFVFLADAVLKGKLSIDVPPGKRQPKGDDWAKIETVELNNGSTVRGRYLTSRTNRGKFRVAGGDIIKTSEIKRRVKSTYYVSFPPFPAVLMLPQTAIHGAVANDVFMTVLVAALILPLFFSVLRRLSSAGLTERSLTDDLWLTGALGFGTVLFFAAVGGKVWYTAHVVGVALAICYVWCCVEARHPILAGLCLGLATMTRTPMAFMFPLFALEAWRMTTSDNNADKLREVASTAAKFAAPIIAIAVVAMIHNYVRFGEPLEFGHSYLAVRQQAQMETIGMFSHHYLSRNMTVAFTLLPSFSSSSPYVFISGHGLAIWVTTPLLFFVLWPRVKNAWHRPLWLTVALVAIPTFFYQNSGWFQFGYRFSLDYMVFLMLLVAVGGRALTRVAKGLIIAGVVINLFGAYTFQRKPEYYKMDVRMEQRGKAHPSNYNVVVPH